MRINKEQIKDFILDNLEEHPSDIAKFVSIHFGVSVQAVNAHLKKLIESKDIVAIGKTKSRKYFPFVEVHTFNYEITESLSESNVWSKDIKQYIPDKQNIKSIWEYGFSEMFNNAIDHSKGTRIEVNVASNSRVTMMMICDNGIGIFRNIKDRFNLLNEREAILELSKGKLTTDKQKHSGEGIFFTSRAFDLFYILSYGVNFVHSEKDGFNVDMLVDDAHYNLPMDYNGTCVFLRLANNSNRVLKDIFDKYAGNEDYGFDKTVIPIKLARYGDDNLVSRSQAKRVIARANLFKSIMLDFTDVPQIGQAFADEIFRVFVNEHPDIELIYIGANTDVEKMIKRAKSVIL